MIRNGSSGFTTIASQDVEVERELYQRLPPLSSSEQQLWELSCTDQRARVLCRSEICRSRTSHCPSRST